MSTALAVLSGLQEAGTYACGIRTSSTPTSSDISCKKDMITILDSIAPESYTVSDNHAAGKYNVFTLPWHVILFGNPHKDRFVVGAFWGPFSR